MDEKLNEFNIDKSTLPFTSNNAKSETLLNVEEKKKTFTEIFTDVLKKVKVSLGLDDKTLQTKRDERDTKNIAKQAKATAKKDAQSDYEELDEFTKIKIDALTTALFNGRDGKNSELIFRNMANMAVNLVGQLETNANIDKVLENVVDEFQNTKSAKKLQKIGLLNVDSAIELSNKLGKCKTTKDILNYTAEQVYGIKVEGMSENQFSVVGLANSEIERIRIPNKLCGRKFCDVALLPEYSDAKNLKTIDMSELDDFTWHTAAGLQFFRESSDKEQPIVIEYKGRKTSLADIKANIDNLNTTFAKNNIYMKDNPEPGYFDDTLYTNGSPCFVHTFMDKSINIPITICGRNIVVTNDFFRDCKDLEEIQITTSISMKDNLEKALETRFSELRENGTEIGNANIIVDYDNSRVMYSISENGNLIMKAENKTNCVGHLKKETNTSTIISPMVKGQKSVSGTSKREIQGNSHQKVRK